MKILLALLLSVTALGAGCVGVGSRVCALHQAGCDFSDHVLRVFPSGTVCPTWNVQFAFYQPDGQPTDTYGVQYGNDGVMETLRQASQNNVPVHVWYAGSNYVVYNKCHSDYPLVIYDAKIEISTSTPPHQQSTQTSPTSSPSPSSSPSQSPPSSSSQPSSPAPSCTSCVTVSNVYQNASDNCPNTNGYNGWRIDTDQGRGNLEIKDQWTGQFKQYSASKARLIIETERGSLDYDCDKITSFREA